MTNLEPRYRSIVGAYRWLHGFTDIRLLNALHGYTERGSEREAEADTASIAGNAHTHTHHSSANQPDTSRCMSHIMIGISGYYQESTYMP